MNAVSALLLSVALAAAPADDSQSPVLYYVTADWCVYCREMKPTVERLKAAGYPVVIVDQTREPDMAQRLAVRGLPAFRMVHQGKIIAQTEGRTSYDELVAMFPQKPVANPNPAPQPAAASQVVRGQSPGAMMTSGNSSAARQKALAATVRLKVIDPNGFSYGTGTVVHSHHGEALVLTCGHLFRDSKGAGEIEVESFAPGASGAISGRLLSYDLDRDVALLTFKPNFPLEAVTIRTPDQPVTVGEKAFTVGCDKGADATIRESRINSINRYQGPDNLQAAGAPIDGRSGGGLFNDAGQLIGVCNAADPEYDEGYYAALKTIFSLLEEKQIAHLFTGHAAQPQVAQNAPSRNPAGPSMPEMPRSQPSMPSPSGADVAMASGMISGSSDLTPAEREVLEYIRQHGGEANITLLFHSKSNPSAQPAAFTLPNRPSPQFLQHVLSAAAGQNGGMVVRGQSQ
ncbi:trypsin-like peptidase domain-containing protein [Blastopirellula sp. JC732]|uniref:Trypsin-like peptidase domain-containing protein n=1 Tax=Blastopirellula sediminis TaxID=2894196 RepID=A0A9X1MLS2_9BACT|nr:trypsin-like peptidase domain-containing protein [Blastopirellula sediminis]MCC9607209.1 trypsin-like peptidase domain-containing protein [Blastopirellula sediminis]MCC9629498.1 trypsin-like peptidase domain-containing protein [Blastopirellula sediminis]